MEIIAIADTHSKMGRVEEAEDAIRKADFLVIAGDITHFGDKYDVEKIISLFKKINPNIMAVPGNCDHLDINDHLGSICTDLHGKSQQHGEIGFFGLGGSNHTPFSTPQEYTDEELKEILEKGYENLKSKIKVMVSHGAPFDTKLDLTGRGIHAGSMVVRKFIENNHVDLVICGHIHESRGIDYIGDTMIVNPGPFHMGYARIIIGDKIECELVRF